MSTRVILGLCAVALLGACGNREEILQGPRFDLRSGADGAEDALVAPNGRVEARAIAPLGEAQPVSLSQPVANSDWTHVRGGPTHRTSHPALSATPSQAWSAGIGAGNSRRNRIVAEPIVAQGAVFTLDATAQVQATSTQGAQLWRTDLTPASERSGGASGGGLAYAQGTVFATTGFGTLTALSAETGETQWTQRLDAPATSAPTVRGGLVYVVTTEGLAWALDAETGRIRWQLPGLPGRATMLGGAGPAVTDSLAIFAFGAEDIVATFRKGGVRRWDASVSGRRDGFVYTTIEDITGAPVVAGQRVYVGNQSGRTVALNLNTGAREWTAEHGSYGAVWPEGGSVYLVNDQAELVRLDRTTGAEIWRTAMPYFENDRERRRKGVYAHYGPVLAGGQLWVASSDEGLRAFDPASGKLLGTWAISGGAASAPAVAGRTLYVLSTRGQLIAFR
ncbi:MAG: PQQ-binding-like beta-propeller repeat protein [Pseudomonadota bacterium]